MSSVARGGRLRRAWAIVGLMTALAATSCSVREGIVEAGTVPPPGGAQMAQRLIDGLSDARAAVRLPVVPRDPALDEWARKGLRLIEAGLPEGVSAVDHIATVVALPAGLDYGVAFEERTPGIDQRIREAGSRPAGTLLSDELMAADPALDGLGLASGGPWSVLVLRARQLAPADAPVLHAALEGALHRERPHLRIDAQLAALAAEVVADDAFSQEDALRYGRAGGVPVRVWHRESEAHLATSDFNSAIEGEDPGSLREPWLDRVGIAVKVADRGAVLYVVLATGEPDRAGLTSALAAAEPKATELVNKARAEAALPPVRLDPALLGVAKEWLAEASRRGCYIGMNGPGSCPGNLSNAADLFYYDHTAWWSAEVAYDWYLAPAPTGSEQLKRFGSAAAIGPDGMVWKMVVFAA